MTKKIAKTLKKLVKPSVVTVDSPLNKKRKAYLHPILWLDQVMLDAQVEGVLFKAAEHGLPAEARRALTIRIISVSTIQASLHTKSDLTEKGDKVFKTPEVAYKFFKGSSIVDCYNLYEKYAEAFDITDEEKKS